MAKQKNIYLDNGATTPVDPRVVKEMLPYFTKKYGNASSIHPVGDEAKETLEKSRAIIAKKINADPNEIIFTSGGTESDNLAIRGVAYAKKDKGNHIITSAIEHPAVMNACKQLSREGFEITAVPVDSEGIVHIEDIEKAITDKTILVSIMHVNNEIGTIQPIEQIGKLARKHGIYFHTDAVQSLCKVPINVKKQNIDLASFSAHKIYGPKGIGALYIRNGVNVQKQMIGGSQEFDKRSGTENISGIVGFAKAVSIYGDAENKRIAKLRDYLVAKITKEILNVKLNGHPKLRVCNNANISFKFVEGESMLLHLAMKGISVSTGSACSSRSLKPSYVLTAIGLPVTVSHGSLRMTLGRWTAKQDIDYFVKNLKEIVKMMRAISPLTRK